MSGSKLAVRVLLTLFMTVVCAAFARPSSLEERLKSYLEGRLLVYRLPGIEGPDVRFNSRGDLVGGGPVRPRSTRTGVLYMDLELSQERLRLLGEPVEIVFRGGEYTAVRDPRRLRITRCTIILDVSLDELTFARAVGLLARVFLTKPEFETLVRQKGR